MAGINVSARDEAVMAEAVQILGKLRLGSCPEAWVEAIWDAQFTEDFEMDDPDLDCEEGNYSEFLSRCDVSKVYSQATDVALKWLKASSEDVINCSRVSGQQQFSNSLCIGSNAGFWNGLIVADVRYKSLVALLFHHMHKGQKLGPEVTRIDRELGLRATGLYFILLAIPGSSAFKIFHPVLYSKALDTFKLALKLHLSRASPKKKRAPPRGTAGGSQRPSQRSKRRLDYRAGSAGSGATNNDDNWDDSDDDDEMGGVMSQHEYQALTQGLNMALFHLLTLLDHFSLKRSSESLEVTVQELVDLTHLETGFSNLDFGSRARRSDASALAYNAYIGLEKVCQPLHGVVEKSQAPLVMKFLMPGILMTPRGSSEIAQRGLAIIRDHSLHFVKHLMSTVGESCFDAVEVLVQNIAVKVPDRSEFRQKASMAVVTLTLGLPHHFYARIVRWFFCLAHNVKSAHRLFAVEVMGKFLAENERDNAETRAVAALDHDYNFGSADIPPSAPEEADQEDVGYEAARLENDSSDSDSETDGSNVPRPKDRRKDLSVRGEVEKSKPSADLFSHKYLFGVIFSKCQDTSATVKAKALQTLANITAANNATVGTVIRNMFIGDSSDAASRRGGEDVDYVELLRKPSADLSQINPLPSTDSFIGFLRDRALDDSVYVRKNALQVLENILKFEDVQEINGLISCPYGKELVGILAEHCRDPSLMVRKQMVTSLTDLVKTYPENGTIIDYWVEAVFPLILDAEQKASEKVLESIWECLFLNLVPLPKCSRRQHFLPWRILEATERLKMTHYLGRACANWAKDKLLTPGILKTLKSHIDSPDNSSYAWLLLALISGHLAIEDPMFVMDYFNASIHAPEGVGLHTLLQVLRVLTGCVKHLLDKHRKSLQKDLITLVGKFLIPPELISSAVNICTIITETEAAERADLKKSSEGASLKHYHSLLDGWAVPMLDVIDAELSKRIFKPDSKDGGRGSNELVAEDGGGDENSRTRMMRQIFTLGELAQICSHRINKKSFLLMQSIVFQQEISKSKRKKGDRVDDHQNSSAFGRVDGGEDDAVARLPVSQSQTAVGQTTSKSFKASPKMQAVAVITLAKMCLQNEPMAKKIIPAFGRLLDTTTDLAVKNNIMHALADMCVRYASLVDPLLPQMTACLKDPSLVVRKTTLTTLIHLLQEDYLKMSGGLFFRILQTLSDESEDILNMTTFYIQQRLIKRKPKIMYSHFIEAIFHFNEYKEHQSYNKFIVSERERRLFSLAGPECKGARMRLYKFMLDHMNDEQRFQTTYKLCQDILGGCVEGSVKLSSRASFELLQDTLACLACDEIKLVSLKASQDEAEGDGDSQDVEGDIIAAAKKTIISQVVKKNVIENIIPIVIALKHRLKEMKSPLLDNLMTYLREVMKDYKNEVKEILSADKQLAAEIQYDLKKWEEEQAELKRLQEERVVSPTQSPNGPLDQERALREVLVTAVSALKKRQMLAAAEASSGQDAADGERQQEPFDRDLSNVMNVRVVLERLPKNINLQAPSLNVSRRSLEKGTELEIMSSHQRCDKEPESDDVGPGTEARHESRDSVTSGGNEPPLYIPDRNENSCEDDTSTSNESEGPTIREGLPAQQGPPHSKSDMAIEQTGLDSPNEAVESGGEVVLVQHEAAEEIRPLNHQRDLEPLDAGDAPSDARRESIVARISGGKSGDAQVNSPSEADVNEGHEPPESRTNEVVDVQSVQALPSHPSKSTTDSTGKDVAADDVAEDAVDLDRVENSAVQGQPRNDRRSRQSSGENRTRKTRRMASEDSSEKSKDDSLSTDNPKKSHVEREPNEKDQQDEAETTKNSRTSRRLSQRKAAPLNGDKDSSSNPSRSTRQKGAKDAASPSSTLSRPSPTAIPGTKGQNRSMRVLLARDAGGQRKSLSAKPRAPGPGQDQQGKLAIAAAKAPGPKTKNMLRAISTPTKNDTIMRENVTFMEQSVELSAITLLSPRTPVSSRKGTGRPWAGAGRNVEEDAESFRFRHGRRDAFEDMMRRDSMRKKTDADAETVSSKPDSANNRTTTKRFILSRNSSSSSSCDRPTKKPRTVDEQVLNASTSPSRPVRARTKNPKYAH